VSLASGTRLGPYEIVALIGSGGMGEVYRARDTRLGRDVAIKVLPAEFAEDPERLRRFEQEARAVAALSHPNVLAVYDVGTHEAIPYLVTELLEGESLRDRLRAGGLTVRKAVETAVQIAQGLAAAHEKGIVHRDLKPGNVFVTRDGQVKILDFGLAKLTHPESTPDPYAKTVSGEPSTESGAVLGTMGYTSPEQLRGERADARSDIFSFGCVLYEMLVGRSPFLKRTGAETVTAIMSEDPAPLSGTGRAIAPVLQEIVSRCLEKRPEDRFSTAHDLALALRATSGGSETPPTIPVRVLRLPGRWIWAGVAVLGAVAAAAVALYVLTVRGHAGAPAASGLIRSIAVLPLTNLSGDPAQEYFSDGMTEELIATLSKVSSLKVISRTSVMQFKGTKKPLREIAAALGVEGVIEGSVLRAGERVRITAQLINASTDTHLWAESYDRDLKDILALQSDVARKVAEALALKLLPGEQARLASARAVDPDAYQAYLKGIQHLYRLTPGDFDSAQQYFELALAKDPSYALAYTGIALVWAGRSQLGFVSPAEAAPKAKAAAQKAIGLDDTVAETHFTLAALGAWVDWDWAVAEREFKRAIELNPSFPEALINYSHFLMNMGRPNEAMPQARRALELDPFNPYFHSFCAVDFLYVRQWDEAIAQARTALATAPDDLVANMVLWYAFGAKGMHKEALAAARVYLKAGYGDRAVDEALERGFAEAGYEEAMRRAAQPLIAHSHKGYVSPMDIASLYVEAGETSRAVDWLEKGYEVRDQSMPYIGWPPFDPLRSDPRFQALARKMNLPVAPPDGTPRPTGVAP
jgi:serine/threonine protein kinase/Tfp pilus assembly protein PilF